MVNDAPRPSKRRARATRGAAALGALRLLLEDESRERIRVSDFLAALKGHAMPALVLLFALPNAMPMPPGTSAVLGLPLVLLTVQWGLGVGPFLPGPLLRVNVARRDALRWLDRVGPWLVRAQPRLAVLVASPCQRFAGALATVLALILLLPIPFGNIPPAGAVCMLALGCLRRDGAWVLAGVAAGIASIAIAWGVVYVALQLLGRVSLFPA